MAKTVKANATQEMGQTLELIKLKQGKTAPGEVLRQKYDMKVFDSQTGSIAIPAMASERCGKMLGVRGLNPSLPTCRLFLASFLLFFSDWMGLLAFAEDQRTSVPAATPPVGPVLTPPQGEVEVFPQDNPWNTRVDGLPVHGMSSVWLESVGWDVRLHPDFGTEWRGHRTGFRLSACRQSSCGCR